MLYRGVLFCVVLIRNIQCSFSTQVFVDLVVKDEHCAFRARENQRILLIDHFA